MFERFTESARQVVVLAQEEARTLKHNYIGTEHILLGLVREEAGLAARALDNLDLTVERVRAQVVLIVGMGEVITSGQIPFTPRAKKVLELALREALSLGHNYIGTEHILLALVRVEEGVAGRIFLDFNARPEKVREEVTHLLSDESKRMRKEAQDARIKVIVTVNGRPRELYADPGTPVAVLAQADSRLSYKNNTTDGRQGLAISSKPLRV